MLPWRTLLLTALALAGYLILGAAPEAWVFDRTAIEQGEVWRLITGHWVHSDFAHALWDIAALGLLGALFEQRLRRRLPLALLAGTLGVDAWLWWGEPGLQYYCGLSGILNTLLAMGLVRLWRDLRHPLVWLTGLGALAKIFLEICSGQALLTQTAWPSIPEVHAVGFLSGLGLAAVFECLHCAPLWANIAASQGEDNRCGEPIEAIQRQKSALTRGHPFSPTIEEQNHADGFHVVRSPPCLSACRHRHSDLAKTAQLHRCFLSHFFRHYGPAATDPIKMHSP